MSALDITLSPEETIELKRRVRSATIPQREGRRARIILLAAQGETRDNMRDGSFASVRELESSITTFMALRDAQPSRSVWNAKGEEILNKIQRAREALEAVQEKQVISKTEH